VTTVVEPDLLRDLTPRAIAALVRHYGHLEDCEDAVQEALAAAITQWPVDGVPDNPRAWLITVASRRLIEQWRRDSARERREQRILRFPDLAPTAEVAPDLDDSLPLLLMCCHPELARPAQVSLTLRAVGGLTTAEIAAGCCCPRPPWPSASAGRSGAFRRSVPGSRLPARPMSGRHGCRRS
jgi:predicted RNA polymerase sigma factor